MAKKFTVIYGTNVLIPDEHGELRPLTFFTVYEGDDNSKAEDAADFVERDISQYSFIKDNGGYYRRTNTIVSFKIKEIK